MTQELQAPDAFGPVSFRGSHANACLPLATKTEIVVFHAAEKRSDDQSHQYTRVEESRKRWPVCDNAYAVTCLPRRVAFEPAR